MSKPLFIPLKTEYFEAFRLGTKTVELRRYGPMWNERTCTPGRAVTLSHGYSGARLPAVVVRLEIDVRDSEIYGPATRCALIHLHVGEGASQA